jgi:hypothetical protein
MMLHCLVFRNIVIERIGCVFDKGNFQLVVISINGRQRKGNVSRRTMSTLRWQPLFLVDWEAT